MARLPVVSAAAITAIAYGFGTAGPAEAQGVSARSADTRAMILAPLQDEMIGPQPLAPQIASASPVTGLRFADEGWDLSADPQTPRPEAARFAASLLSARAEPEALEALSAFQEHEATLATTGSGGRLSVSLFDAADPGVALLGYSSDYAEAAGVALTGEREYGRRMTLRYENSFDSPGGFDGLDVGLSPRAGVSIGDDGPAAEAGATVRLGQYIGDGFGEERPAWWFFAGADRQAVLYDPGAGFNVRTALAMEPYAMVGDAQAGVALRVRGADLSLAYVHRETHYSMPQESWDTSEGFAAFSLTWRR